MNKLFGIGILAGAAWLVYEWMQQHQVAYGDVVGNPAIGPNGSVGPNVMATNAIPANNAVAVQNFPYTSSPNSVNPNVVTTAVAVNDSPALTYTNRTRFVPVNNNTQPQDNLANGLFSLASANGGLDVNGLMGPDQWSYYLSKLGVTLSPGQFDALFDRNNLYSVDQFVTSLKNAGLGRLYVSGIGNMGMGTIGRGWGINSLTPTDATRYEMSSKYIM